MYTSTSTTDTGSLTTPTPLIVGRPVVGHTLRVDTSDWPTGTAFGFQWYSNDDAIGGANEPRLVLTGAHAFTSVTVTVYASVPRQPAVAVRSAPARMVMPSA